MKKIPKIIIRYSDTLDPIFTFYSKNNPELKSMGWNDWTPPSKEEVMKRVRVYKEAWKEYEERILTAMMDILEIDFRGQEVYVHIVSGTPRGMSAPLILSSHHHPKKFVDSLTHELIHELIWINRILKMLPNDTVLRHSLVFAVMSYIFLDVLKEPERIAKEREGGLKHRTDEYVRAWQIVDEKGYMNVIEEFKRKEPTILS